MSDRPAWMDRPHEFTERIDDGSMCVCGIPALYHDEWEARGDDRLFAVDGYRFGEWSLIDAGCRISKLIEAHPEAVS